MHLPSFSRLESPRKYEVLFCFLLELKVKIFYVLPWMYRMLNNNKKKAEDQVLESAVVARSAVLV